MTHPRRALHIAVMGSEVESNVSAPVDPKSTESTASDGRDLAGRFAPGNRAAAGNGQQKRLSLFRHALLHAVTEEDIREVARSLIGQAKSTGADAIAAARLLLSYCVGKPPDVEESGEGVMVVFRRPAMRDDDNGDALETAK